MHQVKAVVFRSAACRGLLQTASVFSSSSFLSAHFAGRLLLAIAADVPQLPGLQGSAVMFEVLNAAFGARP